MIKKYQALYIVLILLFSWITASAQKEISGCVIDSKTKGTVPMVNVYFKGTTIGTMSDSLGYFRLKSQSYKDTLVFSSIGYNQKMIKVSKLKSPCEIFLQPDQINLNEVSVKPDDSWVRGILKRMVKARDENNPNKHERSIYEKYYKREYHLSNVDSALMNSGPFKDHQHLFKTSYNGSKTLPVFVSEQIVNNEYQKKPLKLKSTVVADNTAGLGVLGDYEVGGYTAGLNMHFNFYTNFVKIFDENFASPAASNGWFYYRYYLVDSAMVEDVKHYKILFTPKRKHDKAFRGHMVIENERHSIVSVEAALSSKSNTNFLKEMDISLSYGLVQGGEPFFNEQNVIAKFDYLPFELPGQERRMELEVNQYTSFSNVDVKSTEAIQLSTRSISYESIKLPDYKYQDSTYWNKARHLPLNEMEKTMIASIDSVNDIPVIKIMDNTARMMMTGYYDVGKFELGPYMNFVQFNKIEGVRIYAGGRTSKEISKRWMMWGGVGYGLRTEKISGTLGGGYKLNTIKRNVFKLFYDDRYIRMGENRKILYLYENMLTTSENNLISAFFVRDTFDELHRQKNVNLSYEHEWRSGVSSTLNLSYRLQFSPEFYPFIYQGQKVKHINAFEAALDFRFSFKEKIVDDEFMRLYLNTSYPIFHFTLTGGRVEYANVQDYYTKAHATVKHSINLGQTRFKYALEAGAIFGKVPFSLLEIPRGNETYGYYLYDFNMLNYLEFAHDRYLHGYFDYHLNGFVFNRVPLLRALGLREVLSAKTMIGSLSDKQYESIELPPHVSALHGPYIEVGAGLENIFRLIRIEGVWRVAPDSKVNAPRFGIRAKLSLSL
ncbi:DUF5686 family protein [Carboxylicivirga sp. N1Y90]|uniref:DUF5686 and carboxypeptidase-like regulatory domain-containing protein n=1 Tax=Carboxylicivirga fragile TaxID=3417571 RepID=UPI003D327D61|nr:carboxypeptidase-like regulatory domain-containing protein [Marinilabiliaceae bacterium N1Y90]